METINPINRAIQHLETHLTQPTSVEQAATAAGYSRSHFSRTFASLTGLTPVGYLRHRRLSEAARELVTSSKRILDIALDYQFQSQEAFTRSFKQAFGVNPGCYRQRGRLQRLLHRISVRRANLFYPGRGIDATPPICVPKPQSAMTILTPHTTAYPPAKVASSIKPTVHVRLAHRQDIAALCRLYVELRQATFQRVPAQLRHLSDFECFDATGLAHNLEKLIDAVDVAIWVAEVNGQVVGLAEVYLRVEEGSATQFSMRYGYLQSLIVDQHWRGRRIGAQLLTAVECWSKAQGATELQLDSWEFAASPLGFYTRWGCHTLRRTLRNADFIKPRT